MDKSIADRIDNDFDYHAPSSDEVRARHERARAALKRAAVEVLDLTGSPSREQSLAITKLEEAMFWTNAAIARQQ
jgi:hypothetical protein